MAKKRKFSKDKKQHQPRTTRKNKLQGFLQSLSTSILSFVAMKGEPVNLSEIQEALSQYLPAKKEIEEAVAELVRREELVSAGKKRFRLNSKGRIFTGKIEKNPRGFGFVIDLHPAEAADYYKKDPFLTVRNMGTANHGDIVLIRVNKVRRDGRPEAEILSLLERSSEKLTGFFKAGNPPRVIPEDPRYPSTIAIVDAIADNIEENDVVIVQILPEPSEKGFVQGKICEVLGSAQNIDVQMRMVIEKHNLPHIFPKPVVQEAEALSFNAAEIADRLDLREIAHVTIDGATAKDFDDAIAVEKTRGGYRLYVSIADVSHFVRPDTPLDKEAYLRGTSIYFPGRVIPMLPEKLSNNLCSLVPDEDRLSFSAILDFSRDGKLTSKTFGKSIMRSKHRFTYTTVKNILIDKDPQVRRLHKEFLNPLKWAGELAQSLHKRRMDRGSIGFNIPEPEVSLEEDGKIRSIKRKERNFAHLIIEEFMLAANEAVAELFTEQNIDFIYRIHEKPSPEKVEEFASFAATLGIDLPKVSAEPRWFGQVLEIVNGSPGEYVVNNLLLRTMQQARYDPDNKGHFGLAATDYTHFTSPIRRYPDLMVHRFLDALLQNKPIKDSEKGPSLKEQAEHLSSRERAAVTAERDINDRLKVFFMEQYIGESFKAVISGVSENVLFVELLDLFVSGSIDISTLTDDYYLYDIKRYRLIGEISGKTYQLGASLDVTLVDVDHRLRRINFAPARENGK